MEGIQLHFISTNLKFPAPSSSITSAIWNDKSLTTTMGVMENISLKN